jgi:hypothetical protein
MAQNINVVINLHLLLSPLARASRDHSSAVLTRMMGYDDRSRGIGMTGSGLGPVLQATRKRREGGGGLRERERERASEREREREGGRERERTRERERELYSELLHIVKERSK